MFYLKANSFFKLALSSYQTVQCNFMYTEPSHTKIKSIFVRLVMFWRILRPESFAVIPCIYRPALHTYICLRVSLKTGIICLGALDVRCKTCHWNVNFEDCVSKRIWMPSFSRKIKFAKCHHFTFIQIKTIN